MLVRFYLVVDFEAMEEVMWLRLRKCHVLEVDQLGFGVREVFKRIQLLLYQTGPLEESRIYTWQLIQYSAALVQDNQPHAQQSIVSDPDIIPGDWDANFDQTRRTCELRMVNQTQSQPLSQTG